MIEPRIWCPPHSAWSDEHDCTPVVVEPRRYRRVATIVACTLITAVGLLLVFWPASGSVESAWNWKTAFEEAPGRTAGATTKATEVRAAGQTICLVTFSLPPGTVDEAARVTLDSWPNAEELFARSLCDLLIVRQRGPEPGHEVTVSLGRCEFEPCPPPTPKGSPL